MADLLNAFTDEVSVSRAGAPESLHRATAVGKRGWFAYSTRPHVNRSPGTGNPMRRLLGATGVVLTLVLLAAIILPNPGGRGIVAGLSGRGVLIVPLEAHYAETLCSADGAKVESWPDPPATRTVSLMLNPGGYEAVVGDGPCSPGCRDVCDGQVRWGQTTTYVFLPLRGR